MCEPATIAYGVAAVVAAYGAYQYSATQEEVGDYQSKVAKNQAIVQEQAAEDTKSKGIQAAQDHLAKVRMLKGRQAADFASRGLSLDSGSPMAIMESTEFFGGVDAERIAGNAYNDALQIRNGAAGSRGDAAMYSAMSSAQNPAGSAALSLIGSAGTYGGNYYSGGGYGSTTRSTGGGGTPSWRR